MRYAGAVGGRGRVAFSPAMVAGRPGSGAGRAWLRAHATARPWRRWPAGHRQRAEPSRAGAPRSWRRALVACLLCFGALCFGAPVDTAAAQGPEITTFLDNTISGRRSCGARRYTSDITVVQGFNTGGHRTGYTLREIEFEVEGHPDSFTVYPHITLAEASPLFVSEVATLTYYRKRSVDYAHSVNTMVTYTVPEDVTLDPLVAYYLKFASPGQAGYSIAFSRKKSYRVERPNQYGWSMVSTLYWQRSGWNYYNHTTIGGIPCGIRITAVGYRNVDGPNRLPTSANGRIAAGQGRDYVFGRSDFTFSDPDTLDPFSGLEITLLPDSAAGTLKLDGSALGAQDLPKTVTRSELDSGKFVYTPPSGEPEENIASFGFKVSDGMATSDSSYTMSISRVLPRAVLVSIEPTSTPTRWRPGTESGSSAPDTYGNGDIVEITATFDGDITVSDVPQFMFRYRGDIWLGHNKYFVHSQYDPVRSAAAGRNKAVFTYRVTDPSEFTPGNTGIQIVRKAPCCPGGNPFRLYGEDAIDSANGGGPARLGIANDTVYFGHKFNAGLGSRPPENQAPTSAIGRITATQGAQYAFSVSDFDYHDEDADLLAAIKIVSPPTAGELLLDGSDVAAGASVTRAELDEGALIYRAPEETTGADVASFTFKVSDGLHESATDYAMNIDVQASGQQVEVDAPTIDGTPRVSGAGDDGRWTQGETVRVTIPFSEAVEVDMSGGTPSVGIDLGGTATRSAAYRSGSGTAELAFDYTLVQDDGAHSTMAVTPNSLALNGGTIRGSESQADAQLAHNGAVVQGGSDRDDGPEASFRNVPKSHDGESGFTVGLQFSGEPSGLSAKRDAASVLELTGGTVTGAREVAGGANPAWEVTVQPDGPGDIMLRLPARACDETHAVCIEGEPLDEAAQAMVPGTPLTAQFTQAPETHDGSNAFEVDMDFSHEPAGFSYRTVRDALFDVEGGRIERAQRRERGRNRLWRIRVVPETSGDVTLAVRATTDCAAPYAACGANGRKLAGNARLTVRGPASPTPPAVSVAPPAATPVTEGAALGFALTRTGETTQALTVTVSVTETGTTLSGTPPASATFAAGSDRAVLSVATEDDEASEAASTVTATVSPGEGYTVEDASASAQAVVEDDDAVPVVSTASPIVVAENRTAVATLAATDADTATEALAWSIPEGEAGGADAAQFTLSAQGVVAFRVAKDFEAPDDADGDGDYEVTVRVTDGTNAIDTALVVRLAGTDDAAPVVSTASPIVVAENQTAVVTLTATDADTDGAGLSWSISEGTAGGADAAKFALTAAGVLTFKAAKDFEAPDDVNADGDYEVTVRVTDGSNPVDAALMVRLANVDEVGPTASFGGVPTRHDGATAFRLELRFSLEPLGLSYKTVRGGLLEVTGARVTGARRLTAGSNLDWEVTVEPTQAGDIVITLPARACSEINAICIDGEPLARAATATVSGPASSSLPVISIAATTTPVTEGTAAAFTLSRTGATDAALTVEVSVAETGAAVSGTPSTSVTFAAGSASATLSVATEDDEAEEDASTVTATVASGSGYTVDGASGSADVVVDDDDAAPVVTTASPLVVAENATAVATLAATDADTADEDLAWSIPEGAAGGTDAAQFALTAAGELTFGSAKDFEAPDDADADGDYEVTVRVTDGANPVDAALVVRLTDADDVAPALTGASVDGDELTLTYSEALDGDSVPPESSFAVTVGDSARTVDAAAVSGSTVVLTLSSEVLSGETVTVGYTVPTGADAKPVKDTAGNAVATFTKAPVTNAAATLPVVSIAPSTTPVTEGTAAAFTLSRTGATDAALTVEVSVAETGAAVSGAPPTSVSFDVGSDSATLSVATEDDEAVEDASTVTATVSSGEGYTVDGTSSAAEVVVDDDDAAPVVSTASPIEVAENATAVATLAATDVDTAAEDLAWSVPEGAAGGVDAAQFALTADGALTFKAAKDFEAPDDADADGDYEITVRVTDGANQVDASLVVRLTDTDDAAPTLLSASVDGATVTLTFGEALDEDSKPPASALAVRVGETARTVEAVAISGSTALLTLSPAVTPEETVTVDYAVPEDPEAMALQDAAGNRVASFAATEVENGTAPALPTVSIAAVSTPVTEGAAAAFVLRRTGTGTAELTVTVSVSEAGSVLDGAPPSSATFASGSAEARLNVATANDAIDEADGRVSASIVAGDGYEVDGESASAGVDVFDDDAAAQAAVELWSTTMTWTDIGNNWFGGFADGFSNPGWSEDGQAFRIWFISYEAGSRVLSMAHDGSGGVIAEPGQLTLHVGGLTVGPGEAISTFAGAGYARLGDVDSQWQVGGQVTVRLTRASGDADAAPAGPGLSVADAQVNEAAGAPLRFRVTLDAPAESTVSVRYRTSDGTAQAGADYVAAHGTVRFARGETAKTVEVAVLPDDHDEGSETMTLTLSGSYGATVADGTATGTISNTGAIPKAWIARFGRTVAEQAIEAVEARFEAPHVPGLSGTIGGQSISGVSGPESEAGEAWGAGADARQGLEALSGWFGGEGGDEDELGFGTRTLSGREVLTGTSFGFTAGSVETGFASFWGRGAVTSFDGRDGGMTLDGEVASAMLGADFSRDALLGGLMLSHSRGEGGYRSPDGNGEVESTLTALFPYARYAFSERVSVWGMAGYGEGTLTVTPEGQAPLSPDMDFLMGALGVRGVLLDGGHDGPTLAAKSDAFAVRTSTDAVSGSAGNLEASQADVTRVRFALEGSRPFGLGGDAVLTPSLELGVRHDDGDAETGFGADIGAGLVLSDPARGISAEVRARGLLTHEAEGMRERGLSGTLAFDPAPDTERGLSLSLTQSVGVQGEGGVDALLKRRTFADLGAEEEDDLSARRLDALIGYGIGVFEDRYTATPELGLGLSDRDRELRLGWRLTEQVGTGLAFEFGLEGTRREFTEGDAGPEHGLGLGFGWRLAGRGTAAFDMRVEAVRLVSANDDEAPQDQVGFRATARW